MNQPRKYLQILISLILMVAGVSTVRADAVMFAPLYDYVFDAALVAILLKIAIIFILLKKKYLNIINLAIRLFIANIITSWLFVISLLSFAVEINSSYLIIIPAIVIIIIIIESFILAVATQQAIFRNPKTVFAPVTLGNIASYVFVLVYLEFYTPPPFPTTLENKIIGQGTWNETLEARDFDGNKATTEAYYDTVLDITWLADANYSGVSRIWSSANDWIDALDINGNTDWRLPLERPIKDVSTEENEHLILELNHLYYATLGNKSGYRDFLGEGLTNTGPFLNVQKNYYWTGTETVSEYYPTEHHPDPTVIVTFNFGNGGSSIATKNIDRAFVWAVHDGDVGSPIPK